MRPGRPGWSGSSPRAATCGPPGVVVASAALKAILHWFRRDLRVSDNTALHEADRRGGRVLPVFVWDDAILQAPDVGPARVEFLLRSLRSLEQNLASLGHRLVVRRGRPEEVLPTLAREAGAGAVFANRDYEPYARARDARVSESLTTAGVEFRTFKDSVVWEEREILTRAGGPFTVFTPYSRAWKERAIPDPRPRLGPARPGDGPLPASLPLLDDAGALGHPPPADLPPAGERAGLAALDAFLDGPVTRYATARDFPAEDMGTSRLSPHLRFGTVNIRTVLQRLQRARASAGEAPAAVKGCDVWLSELVWREFYIQVLANHPHVATRCFRPEYDALEWEGGDERFDAWCAGRTGYPIVDAAMRCLSATGWMHNRLRMITAMFLTKDLLVSWQRGERWFMRRLVDGDLAANNGGWQWSAGTGTDAAPYFRIFNPVTQGRKFDPEGRFIRRWIPELSGVPDAVLHAPWEDPLWLGRTGYPRPVVDHATQRQRCLDMFARVRAPADT